MGVAFQRFVWRDAHALPLLNHIDSDDDSYSSRASVSA